MGDEPRYTLGEARQMLRDEQCAAQMHRLTPVDGSPNRLYCPACQRTFDLVPVAVGARSAEGGEAP